MLVRFFLVIIASGLLSARPAAGQKADNSRCFVCHVNFSEEKLAVTHADAGISCEKCHGASDAHCNDEDNITPPEIMYPRAKINATCKNCHPQHKPGAVSVADLKAKVCTDCHGKHRLSVRTREWDKETGKLLKRR